MNEPDLLLSPVSRRSTESDYCAEAQLLAALQQIRDSAPERSRPHWIAVAAIEAYESRGGGSYLVPPPEAVLKYQQQRQGAKNRGIAWDFTFKSWWSVWAKSGKWPERGQASNQYAMGRNGDQGPYSPGNVRIITSRQNAEERNARVKPPTGMRLGTGKGWVKHARCVTRPYEARLRGKSLGWFATEEEAASKYREAVAAERGSV